MYIHTPYRVTKGPTVSNVSTRQHYVSTDLECSNGWLPKPNVAIYQAGMHDSALRCGAFVILQLGWGLLRGRFSFNKHWRKFGWKRLTSSSFHGSYNFHTPRTAKNGKVAMCNIITRSISRIRLPRKGAVEMYKMHSIIGHIVSKTYPSMSGSSHIFLLL